MPTDDPPASALVCRSERPSRRTSASAFTAAPPDPDDPLLAFEPVPHVAPRHNSITADKQRAFIAALAASGIVTQAAREIGRSLEALYKLRQRPGAEGFRAAWDAALDRGVERLEDCALAQALEGEEVPIVSGGKLLGWHRKRSVALTLFFLRQRRPDRYGPLPQFSTLKPGNPTYDRLRREWRDEEFGDEQAVLDSIDAMIDRMRERSLANAALLAEGEEDGDC
ncbi:MAG: hypothetical protein ABW203_07925 [Novosphingobium sp.]